MRTQLTTKGSRDAGSSCSFDRGLHRYLRNFGGGGVWTPQTTPLGTPLERGSPTRGHVCKLYSVQLHLSGLVGKASHPDMQKIRIMGFFF